MSTPNYFFYISFALGIIFIIYRFAYIKKAPLLTDVVQLFLAVMAACSSVQLFFFIFEGSKSLGDFQSYKVSIVLGAFAVTWVSLQTLGGLVKNSNAHRRSSEKTGATETT